MGRGRWLLTLAAAGALLAGAVGASRAAAPGVPWTEYLPALPSPSQDHPNRIRHCERPSMHCVRVEIQRMRDKRDELGCDHRAVFATTYMVLTQELRTQLAADPDLLRWKPFFFREDALFANVYFRSLRRWEQGREMPPAWRIAFETARDGEVLGAQDMLLGINAHVQNDMPFVVAQLGLRTRGGKARKPDHDRVNDVLNAAYEDVVTEVRERYDPSVGITNPPGVPADDVAGLEMVRQWRENVWRNAERLQNAENDEERAEVAADIKSYAAEWARGIASSQTPGYRAQRDAYCEQRRGG